MGYRYLVEKKPFEKDYLSNLKEYSIKNESGIRESSYDKLLTSLRSAELFKSTMTIVIDILRKSHYARAKGAYSNPITQEFIKNLKEYIANVSN